MQFPGLEDTIVAVSTGWEAAPLGIIRVSGSHACDLVEAIITPRRDVDPPADRAVCFDATLSADAGHQLPATIYRFPNPNSYTGQDIVEIHTVGNLPLLRLICSKLLELGGRRALPGEFTARAYLNGKLDAQQVDGVLELIHAGDQAGARRAARMTRGVQRGAIAEIEKDLIDLLAAIEAGIDFVEEEDVRFITADETRRRLGAILGRLDQFRLDCETFAPTAQPHVALAGLPNAGKSTLFNTLLGTTRAIVAPVIGTTRDVLSAELKIDGCRLVIQDCAGLGKSVDELDAAAHLAAERTADQADLVLWVHDARATWLETEIEVCRRLAAETRILVLSQIDRAPDHIPSPPARLFHEHVSVSAVTEMGIVALRAKIAGRLARPGGGAAGGDELQDIATAVTPLRRAIASISGDSADVTMPEIVAFELRAAVERLSRLAGCPIVEDILGRIFSQFCVGK